MEFVRSDSDFDARILAQAGAAVNTNANTSYLIWINGRGPGAADSVRFAMPSQSTMLRQA
jgi:hypothetical protein